MRVPNPISFLVAIICLCLAEVFSVNALGADPWFPYEKGRYWIYDGEVDYLDEAAMDKAVTRKLTWVTRVHDTIETGSWSL